MEKQGSCTSPGNNNVCNPEVFKNGKGACVVDGSSAEVIEVWVKKVAAKAEATMDWHWCGGVGNVLYLGDDAVRERVLCAIGELARHDGIQIMSVGKRALYRKGVDQPPEGAIGFDAVLRAWIY
jgi:hypothetical protein